MREHSEILSRRPASASGIVAFSEPRIRKGDTAASTCGVICRTDKTERFPLSLAQERLWLLDQLQPGSALYTIFTGLKLIGPLNATALDRSLSEVLRRHEILRTNFRVADGEPVQVVSDPYPLEVEIIDLRHLPENEREPKAYEIAAAESKRPFDLARDRLFRVRLLQLAANLHVIIVAMPHIISDGWSVRLLISEIGTLYNCFAKGNPSPLPELSVQYKDYAAWQRDWVKSEEARRYIAHWRTRLAGAPAVMSLPLDHARPVVRSFRGGEYRTELPADLIGKLRLLCLGERATLFMGMLSAFSVLLHRYCRQTDVVVGSPVASRDRLEVEGLIGFFSNTLPFRTDLSGNPSFRELLRRVRDRTMDDLGYQSIPVEMLIDELLTERNTNHSPFFQAMLVMQPPSVRLKMPSLDVGELPRVSREGAKFDLILGLNEANSKFIANWEVNIDLFDIATLERFAEHFGVLLAGVVGDPDARISDVALLRAQERHRLVKEWTATAADYPSERCVHELFAGVAARTPDAVAVICEERHLSYGELERRANRLAHHLRSFGVGPEVVVGLCVERSLDMVVGLLGILKAGGAYLPLDPSYPQERLAYMLSDAGAPVVVTQASLAERLAAHPARLVQLDTQWDDIARQPASAPVSQVGPDNIAYVLYTSGSTGRPKGVLGHHRGIVSRLHWDAGEGAAEVYGQKTTLNFIDAIWELFMPLIRGGRTIVLAEAAAKDPTALVEVLARHGTTRLVVVPSLLRALLQSGAALGAAWPSLRYVVSSGEALPPELAEQCGRWLPGVKVLNIYGTSEFWDASWYDSGAGSGLHGVPLGRPLANMRLYVLDERLGLAPIGVTGELFVGGVGVARGYLGRAGLTAERFVPSPFGDGERLYRSGDLARWRADGELEFVGRLDHQVKLRGYRIELGEVEAVLRGHAGVKDAVVVAREDAPNEQRLVGYVVGDAGAAAPDAGALRAHLKQSLPEHMMPSAFMMLDALPLTPNGKIDRTSLPAPDGATVVRTEYVAPRNPTEEVLAGIWAEVLKIDNVGVNDNFFDLGGHSLLATRVTARIREVLGIELPLRALFEAPTLEGQAAHLEKVGRDGAAIPSPLLEARRHTDELPLSFEQERLWLLDQLEALGPAYNVPVAVRLQGRLDVAALERCFAEMIRRHEVLRTRFMEVDGSPVRVIEPAGWFRLEVEDLSEVAAAAKEREATARRRMAEIVRQPFELTRGRLLRAVLLRLSGEEHVAVVVLHHIVSDGWSMGILIREIGALYAAFIENKPSPLPELGVQYSDYALWQREQLAGEVLARQVGYWKERLAGAPAALDLATDRVRPVVQNFKGAEHRFAFSTQLARALGRVARAEGATLFMVLLAAFQVVLSRWSGQRDVVVGTPIAGRTHRQSEGLIGLFVNTLALRTDMSGDPTFRELVRRVKEVALGAYAHQDLPFEKLVEELQPVRDLSRQPLFQVLFVLQNIPRERLQLPGLKLSRIRAEYVTAKFDLALHMSEMKGLLYGLFEYSTDLFDAATIERFVGHLRVIARAVGERPNLRLSELPLLTQDELETQRAWNATDAHYPDHLCIHQIVEARAREAPQSPALTCGDVTLSYAELNRRSNQVAHYLRSFGVGPEVVVGLCIERSLDMVVGLLGILKAGGAYLPLDPSYPVDRLAFMVQDAAIGVVLAQRDLVSRLPSGTGRCVEIDGDFTTQPEHDPLSDVVPENAAYVIYTSGSTGRPKGVVVPHRGAINAAQVETQLFAIQPGDRILQFASLNFDASTFEMLMWMGGGATLCLAANNDLLPGSPLLRTIRDNNVTVAALPPSALAAVPVEPPESLRMIIVVGEACPAELVGRWRGAGKRVFNAYGPTEITIWVAGGDLEAGRRPTIGRPIANGRIHILDADMNLVPVGVTGEIYIAGVGVARGYLGRAALTAERFIPSPFGDGERLYRSGDLARWQADGEVEFLGRIDHQVKLRGYRIELGEVEAALRSHADVKDAVVVAREDTPGEKRLVGYVVARNGAARPDAAALRAHMKQSLPHYMIPAALVLLDALPLMPNGKIDRNSLPAPDGALVARTEYVAPRNSSEKALAGIWCGVLKVGKVGVNDNFFELGGHSLLATRVIAQVRQELGIELPLRAMFEAPTLGGLAARIEAARETGAGTSLPLLEARSHKDELPLSFAQERLWLLDQLEALGSAYHVPVAVRLQGRLDIATLERCFVELIRRHRVLRTRFTEVDGSPVRVIEPAGWFRLELEDLSEIAAKERETTARRRTAEIVRQPFELERGRLLRAVLLRLSGEEHVAIVVLHHIVSDGWSMGILIREIGALYAAFIENKPSPLPELGVQYSDYALWQRERLKGETLARQVAYWKEHLAGAPAALDLPTDRARPAVQNFKGKEHLFALSAELTRALGRLARDEGATLFIVLLAAFQVMLARWSGQRDIVVGTPIAGRTQLQSEDLIGLFVDMLPLRLKLSADLSFRELLRRVKEVALGAYAHQELPFEKLVAELQPVRDLSRQPIFQVMFAVQNAPRERLQLPGLKLTRMDWEHVTAKFDLSVHMAEVGSVLRGSVYYATELFDRSTIAHLGDHYTTLLEGIVADPDRRISACPLLTEAERHQLLVEWNGKAAYPREGCVHDLFAAQAARTPDAVAATCDDRHLTYDELDRRSNRLAHHLKSLGIGPEVVVGICVERSLDMVVGLLGILKAGGAYLPLDPNYPPERLAYMLGDAGAQVLVTQTGLMEQLPGQPARRVYLDADWEAIARHPATPPEQTASPDNLAYMIYTSGSTGRPKGVMTTHACVTRLFAATQAWFAFDGHDVWTLFHSYAFDFSVWEIWGALLYGGRVVVVPYWVSRSPEAFRALLAREKVTVLNQTPSAFKQLMRVEADAELALRRVIFGGEALDPAELRPWFLRCGDARPQLVNMYGITETTVHVSYRPLRSEDAEGPAVSPIGRGIPDLKVYVLDDHLQPVPIGASGELYVGGAGLARGYFQRPELTAERFVPSPFGDGERLYRSGDMARWRAHGDLEFLGRIDHQVKLRGYRIELGEIEAALRSHAGIKDAVVVAREDVPGEKHLVGYVVGRNSAAPPDAGVLRAHIKQGLPDYMVPSAFVALDALPLTANGKLDRDSLPTPEARPQIATYVAPHTPTEEALAGIWADVLKVDKVGVNDNFFDLGGHSLLATRVTARVRDAFRAELPLRTLFEAPTLEGLAAAIEVAREKGADASVPLLEARSHKDELPLSFAQERLWLLDQLEALGSTYNIPVAVRLQGRLDVAALEQSFAELIQRHEILRTRFAAVDSRPVQMIEPAASFRLELEDLSAVAATEREAEARRRTSQIARERLDLERGPLFRVALLRLSVEEHVAVVVMHHVVSDGWSMGILIQEIGALYAAFIKNKPSPLPELAVQYADYAIWQRAWLEGKVLERQVEYWRERFKGAPAALVLPTDRTRPAVQSFKGAAHRFVLSPELMRTLGRLARDEGATLFMVLLAAFQVVLARWSGQKDIVVGTPIAGRTQRQTEALIGLFVNMLALRTELSGNPSFRALLRRVKEIALGAYAHQDLPFEKLVEELQPVRDLSRQPIFQVLFALQNMPQEIPRLSDLTFKPFEAEHVTAKLDLSLYMHEAADGLHGVLEYATELFGGATLERFAEHFGVLLAGVVGDPDARISDVALLRAQERHRLVKEWTATAADYPSERCVHELFAGVAARTPDAVAVICEERHLSYGELERRANRLAHHLQRLGVGPEVVVGLCVERSLDMVVGLLGILKAGGAYLPLDPSYPQERLAYMLSDAGAPVVVTQASLAERLAAHPARLVQLDTQWDDIARQPASAPVSQVGPDNIAYVLYTSGSTGRPKGVLGHHRGIVSRLHWDAGEGAAEVYGQKTTLNFIDAIWELFMPLIRGGRTIVLAEAAAKDPTALVEVLARHGTTRLVVVPSLLRALLQSGAALGAAWPSLRYVVSSGEALPPELAEQCGRWLPGVKVLNIYGTSEFWDASWYDSGAGSGLHGVPLGRPLANMRLYVLDERLGLAPIGVTGELFVGGVGVARGYLGRAGLTAERFVPSPFGDGERLYRSGDLARWRADGELEFVGRLDHQVKLRGYRIELGEVEAVLRGHAGVKDAVVVAREDAPNEQRLVGYVVGHAGAAAPDAGALRAHLKQSLPEHMMPSAFMMLDALPLTPNGKIDRTSLPAPDGATVVRTEYVAPRNPTEEVLAGIWAEVLKIDNVGVNDNFFDLGGHSLLLLQLHRKLKTALDRDLSLMSLFRHPTIHAFETFLGEETRSRQSTDIGHDRNLVDTGRDRGQRRRQFVARPARPSNQRREATAAQSESVG